MLFLITIFGEKGFGEYSLPDVINVDYKICLSKNKFCLEKNVFLLFENIDSCWYLLKNKEYVWIEEKGGGFRRRITEDMHMELLVNEKRLSLSVRSVCDDFPAYKKYEIKSNISIGRGEDNDIALEDVMQTASRKHSIIKKEQNQWIILNQSINGIYINGETEKTSRTLCYGDCIYIAGLHIVFLRHFLAIENDTSKMKTTLKEITGFPEEDVRAEYLQEKKPFHRAPRSLEANEKTIITIREPPPDLKTEQMPLFMTIGSSVFMMIPMLIGSLFMLNTSDRGNGKADAYVYSGLIMVVTTFIAAVLWGFVHTIWTRKRGKKAEKIKRERYEIYLEKKKQQLTIIHEKEKRILRERYPDAQINSLIDERSVALWNRNFSHPDYFVYRLGLGEIRMSAEIETGTGADEFETDNLREKKKKLQEEFQYLKEAPVLVDLEKEKQVGLVGDSSEAIWQLIHILSIQIATNNCYTEVKIGVVYDENTLMSKEEWDYFRWLPHIWSEGKTKRFIASNQEEARQLFYEITQIIYRRMSYEQESAMIKERKKKKPFYILFISAIDFLDGEPVAKYLNDREKDYGIYVIWIAREKEDLPNSCGFVIENTKTYQGFYDLTGSRQQMRKIQFDNVCSTQTAQMARKMASIEVMEKEETGNIPEQITFFEMLRIKKVEEIPVLENWKKSRTIDTLKAEIGVKAGGKLCFLDIHEKFHGPHGLVAGTTGSGKSELLQTYILSMAVRYSPEEVNFFLIDYKGSGMAGLFEELPHLCGHISNLSKKLTKRALAAIKAENTRRQEIFKKYRINHINQYISQRYEDSQMMPLPHLLIIIDEFAELKKEEPDFMEELISVAQVGRSLGIHLILATQKPGGTVNDRIWSNTKFRLCLRVQEEQDSQEMLHKQDAAFLSQVGRGYFQAGRDEVYELFQSAWSGAAADISTDRQKEDVQMLTLSGRIRHTGQYKEKISGKSQGKAVTEYIQFLAEKYGIKSGRALWKEPLPEILFTGEIKKFTGISANDGLYADVGLIDDMANQVYKRLRINLRESGHIVICGMPHSGKSTFLQTMLFQFMSNYDADTIQFYIIDYSGGMLEAFRSMPQTGGMILPGEEKKAGALFSVLEQTRKERRKFLHGGTWEQHLKNYPHSIPAIAVVIDNFSMFQERTNQKYEEQLLKICKEGEREGIFVIASCGGFSVTEMPLRFAGQFRTAICLEMKEKYMYGEVMGDLQIDGSISPGIRGRGLIKTEGRILEFQTALCCETTDEYKRMEDIREYANEKNKSWNGTRPRQIREVSVHPQSASFFEDEEVKAYIKNSLTFPLGYEEDTAEIYYLNTDDIYCFLISGKKRSGRHNLLKVMIETARRKTGKVCIIDLNQGLSEYKNLEHISCYMTRGEEIQLFLNDICAISNEKEESGEKDEIYYIFVEDIMAFLEIADVAEYAICQKLEKLWKKNKKNIIFVAVTDVQNSNFMMSVPLLEQFCSFGTGVHLGGNLIEDNFFCHDKVSYEEQTSGMQPGQGFFFERNKVHKIIIPMENSYD